MLCDGIVLHGKRWNNYRDWCEATRLTNAQLILGLQRIKSGGTLIILPHELDKYYSMMLIRAFCTFATVELFKPKSGHAITASCYMVAKDVRPHSVEAEVALKRYKGFWHDITFPHGVENARDRKKMADVKVAETESPV